MQAPDLSPKNPLWQFTDDNGSFTVKNPQYVSRLYFPLANSAGILSSITPDLNGDIKSGHNSFLTLPVSVEDLHNTKSSRNFWAYIHGIGAWSLTGVSASQDAGKFSSKHKESVTLDAGMLWHSVTRINTSLGLRSEIVNFCPIEDHALEIMIVTLQNTSKTTYRITPTSAIPIFGRSADNLRDHHHVTSLLHRVIHHPYGVVVKPTMSFDERGHHVNNTLYTVLGVDHNSSNPLGYFSTVESFIGEGGDFENPRAVLENQPVPRPEDPGHHGKPAIGALRFNDVELKPSEKASFVLLMGIAHDPKDLDIWVKKFGSPAKAQEALRECKSFWQKKSQTIRFRSQDDTFNNWMRWVGLQPYLRKLFGCSFLPDFDYGRGGRGWRDLWQDCLALLLSSADEARPMLLNNYAGIRVDGSNATIIGQKPGEFIADRNNITRVWMDHGVWPFLTTELYIHQTGDFDILFEQVPYFRDRQLHRARVKDAAWSESSGNQLKTKKGRVIRSSVIEHVLVQNLVQFFNVGQHNNIRLENADWNDGLDMAYDQGESVAFSCFYAWNLSKIADLLEILSKRKKIKSLKLIKELALLLDRTGSKKVDYSKPALKNKQLNRYFESVCPFVSGQYRSFPIHKIISDLREKSKHLTEHIQKNEWLAFSDTEGVYNGYYDNHSRRVEGAFKDHVRVTLTGQVFSIMSQVATHKQTQDIFRACQKYLRDKNHGGFRLNTDFGEIRLDLGRAFSFAYGEKENGAFFSHMCVMFSNALYSRDFVSEGHQVMDSIYRMCVRTHTSKIYPGLPEYFNSEGRGLYHYLTGSASWLIMTLLTQVYGVKGLWGDLRLAPKFTQDQFQSNKEVSVEAFFAGRRIKVSYTNPKKISYEHYAIKKVTLNSKPVEIPDVLAKEVLVPKSALLAQPAHKDIAIHITLG